jgi:hypothetical protein
MTLARVLFLVPFVAVASGRPGHAAEPVVAPGLAEVSRLDTLAMLRTAVSVGSVSSADRTGGNDDGFSGKYSFVRKEPGGLVIADLQGPGVVYRIWTPTPTDDVVAFYLDGESEPRIALPFRELFTGTRAPFVAPLVGSGAGGFYSYLPVAYARSLKVVIRAEKVQFYQVNFARYPEGTPLASFSPGVVAASPALERARELLAATGTDVSRFVAPANAAVDAHEVRGTLAPGGALTLLDVRGPGRLVGLRIGPARAFAGPARDIRLRIRWDGESGAAVDCPVGDFFGYAWGRPAMRALVAGTTADENYVYLPMPWDSSATIELVSDRTTPVEIQATVETVAAGRRPDEARFYAIWRRENPAMIGQPFTFADVEGRGHVVGVMLQSQGMEPGAPPTYFEGDDQAAIDGELAVQGTGSEDFFNGGWYDVPGRWESRVSLPLSGCLDYVRPLGRSAGYRFLLTDAYAFRRSLRFTIEHGPTGNTVPSDYTSVTYLYATSRPAGAGVAPTLEARRIVDPPRVVFSPGWNMPIHAFSWSGATVTRREDTIGGASARYLGFAGEGADDFGPHYVALVADMPAAGIYRISLEAIAGPAQGIVQLVRNEAAAGDAVDLYAAERARAPAHVMGTMPLDEGPNRLFFKLVGRHPSATGLGLQIVRIVCERTDGGSQ